eukprot:gene1136-667_t
MLQQPVESEWKEESGMERGCVLHLPQWAKGMSKANWGSVV